MIIAARRRPAAGVRVPPGPEAQPPLPGVRPDIQPEAPPAHARPRGSRQRRQPRAAGAGRAAPRRLAPGAPSAAARPLQGPPCARAASSFHPIQRQLSSKRTQLSVKGLHTVCTRPRRTAQSAPPRGFGSCPAPAPGRLWPSSPSAAPTAPACALGCGRRPRLRR
jgi:hypothetical protein